MVWECKSPLGHSIATWILVCVLVQPPVTLVIPSQFLLFCGAFLVWLLEDREWWMGRLMGCMVSTWEDSREIQGIYSMCIWDTQWNLTSTAAGCNKYRTYCTCFKECCERIISMPAKPRAILPLEEYWLTDSSGGLFSQFIYQGIT